MTIKAKLKSEPGFHYIIDAMELMSAPGRRRMLQQPFLTDIASLNREYEYTAQVIECLKDDSLIRPVATIRHQLMQIHELQGTLQNLQHRMVLEEIELFEIKHFAFLCMETVKAAEKLDIVDILLIPDLREVFSLLDPDQTNIPNFYIYDSYHADLPDLRRQLKAKQTLLENSNASADENAPLQREINDLFEKQNILQQSVINDLSVKMYDYLPLLSKAYEQIAYTDFLFAKATLAESWNLCRPEISESSIYDKLQIQNLWNPRLKHRNTELNMRYQPIDIELYRGVCLITGANMAGKTVLLKTVGITQLMAQFGFYVPAETAMLPLVEDVLFCIGDEQNEMNGLSSFASEIIKISDTVRRSKKEHLLILIDEPARTTNPVEGKAIVQSVVSILDERESIALITTHYSQLGIKCRRLRVKGFVETMSDTPMTPENINRFMDYSLIPDNSDDVPREALRIAEILNCNSEMLIRARNYLKKTTRNIT